MRKIVLFALVFSAFGLMINNSASQIYDPPNETYTWEWQEYGPRVDEVYFKIIKPERPLDPAQELYVDSFDGSFDDWTMVGDSPYLNATDYPDSCVESNTYCNIIGFFSFEDMDPLGAGEEITGVTIDAYAWSDSPEIDCDIYIFGLDFNWIYIGSIEASNTWSWVFPSFYTDITPYTNTSEMISDLRVALHYYTSDYSSGSTVIVDALRLSIYTRPLEDGEIRHRQVTALQTGEIDVLPPSYQQDFPSTYFINMLKQEGFSTITAPWFNYFEIGFNMRKWPFEEGTTGNAFRHAIAHLVPRDDLTTIVNNTVGWNVYNKLDTHLPTSLPAWLNTEVDLHPYNSTEATVILTGAGFTFDVGLNNWRAPNGTELPVMKVFVPPHEPASVPYDVVERIVNEMHDIGLNSVEIQPMDFQSYMNQVKYDHDFDMYWSGWGLDDSPSFLYLFFHASQDVSGLLNVVGIHNSTLDTELEVIQFSTNVTAIQEAVFEAQVLLSELLPRIPLFTKNLMSIFNPNLDGIVNMYGYGADNQWTFLNIHRHGIPLGGTLNWTLPRSPEFITPVKTYNWDTGLDVLDCIFDGLLAVDPGTGELMPWLATNWTIRAWDYGGLSLGMNMTFWLRDDVYWQDSVEFTAEDVKFSLEYIQEHQLREFGENLVEVVIPPANPYVVEVHLNTSSYWLLDDITQVAASFPKHIWDSIADPQNFRPWTESHPNATGLTKLIGTGPFYFVEYVPGDYVLLRRNTSYFKKLPTSTSKEVGVSGGNVSNVARTSSVEIPPGALTENTTITIEQYPTSDYGGFLINQSDNIVSYGVYDFGPEGTTFEGNVTITLTYNETAVDENQLEQLVVYSSDDGVNWHKITIESVDTIENTITIKVNHFSLFVALQSPTPQEAIERLVAAVEGMNLQQGIDNSLDAKLASALDALDALNADQRSDAVNKLNAFMNEVEAQRGKKLSAEQADYLMSEAQGVVDRIQR
ncbi:MAG: hypothetical protein JSV85_00115 [Candidatus Bathyarchaeota archaeon]|nr:MAG: hypothetical protein JSV85_00115 [Candidatus Bathyarchaeota archaeon]